MAFTRLAVLTAVVLATATAAAPAQGWAEKMFPDGLVHDFGSVPRGGQLFHRFKIENKYAVQMQITEVRSGCGCVTASATKRVLEPREATFIEVNMDSRLFTGAKTVVIHVSVGPQFVSTAQLRVTAISRADIVCNPSHLGFGAVAAGATPPTQIVDVEYAGALEWKVLALVVPQDVPVTATIKEKYRFPGKVGYQLQATLNAEAPAGTLKKELFLKTNDPVTPLVPVLVEATIQSSLSASPRDFNLEGIHPGDAHTRRVIVRATRPFTVREVEGLGNGLSLGAELSNAPATVQTLTFKLLVSSPGQFRRELKIKTDVQDEPLVVTIHGSAE